MSKVNPKILKLIQTGAKLVKTEQAAKATYETAKEKRVEHMAQLEQAGAVKGMEQATAKAVRVVREQVNVSVPYGRILQQLKEEYPEIADRADELVAENRKRQSKLTVKELEV
jgi:hypothetical protein